MIDLNKILECVTSKEMVIVVPQEDLGRINAMLKKEVFVLQEEEVFLSEMFTVEIPDKRIHFLSTEKYMELIKNEQK
jgi:hypothetical protein